jgi:phage baseplate assembly protein W
MKVDLRISVDGELQISPQGDLDIVWGDDAIAQEILVRLKTTPGDYLLSPRLGADLEQFIGAPNNKQTHSLIEQVVHNAITFDNLVSYPAIQCVSINTFEVFILIEFASKEEDSRVIQVYAGLDLKEGLVYERIDFRNA